jgi:hypothetical protein
MIERRRYSKGARGATLDLSARPLGYMDASAAECVDVVFFQAFLVGKGLRVGGAIFLNDLKLQL